MSGVGVFGTVESEVETRVTGCGEKPFELCVPVD